MTNLENKAKGEGFRKCLRTDPHRGIQHLVGPEQGLTQPGVIILCGDSHTSTQGAYGALAFGIGGELAHVLATQTICQRRPKKMCIHVEGVRPFGVSAKDARFSTSFLASVMGVHFSTPSSMSVRSDSRDVRGGASNRGHVDQQAPN